MEVKIALISSLILLLVACNKTQNNNNVSLERGKMLWEVGTKDTTLVERIGNSFVKYHIQRNGVYTLEWGNENVNNISKDTFEVLGSGILCLML